MSLTGFLVLEASVDTVRNLRTPGFFTCGGLSSTFPALPPSGAPECSFSGPLVVVGWATMAVLLAAMVWSWWLIAGWALRPLADTAQTVRRLGPQNLGQRIRLAGGADSFKDLANAIDDALDRLAAGYESQRRFAANASHELRTPLAVQRLLTEVALEDPAAGHDLRRLGGQLLVANERNERLIEGLLTLAESDRGLQGVIPVRLDELAAKALDSHRELADKHDVTLRRKLTETTLPGDPVLLERLIVNLVSNAITYNEPSGWVEVEVEVEPPADAAGQHGTLIVRNTGPQVPAESVTTMFEPFRRLGADRLAGRGGVGLGLAIVRSIVTAHGGTVHARPRQDGGLEVKIELPARPG
jgi:signal transduction histidine kinase